MLAKARRNAQVVGVANVEFRAGRADALPVPAESIDVVITNGVFNLCTDKPKVIADLFRVLKPGGQLVAVRELVTASQWAVTCQTPGLRLSHSRC